ncbi:MAG TPA: hypothetical protein PLM60_02245 [Methanoregulaceae archaeon]|jgi:hypothetical protein|nr:hypothetical protein [Methanomicrobiales archaeon]HPS22213.1 hypothetical protein [Methanoregulaceae archaeon]HQN89479.1 hypothetical protein [Methanoregulaceae archaeon]HQP82455.1 hypothetical protein [Methanoregulaceae archaeon]
MEPAEGFKNNPAGFNPENSLSINNTCTCTDQYSGGWRYTQYPGNAGSQVSSSVCPSQSTIVLKALSIKTSKSALKRKKL